MVWYPCGGSGSSRDNSRPCRYSFTLRNSSIRINSFQPISSSLSGHRLLRYSLHFRRISGSPSPWFHSSDSGYWFTVIADRLAGVSVCQRLSHFALFPRNLEYLDSAVKDPPVFLVSPCIPLLTSHGRLVLQYVTSAIINSVLLYHSFPISKSQAIRLSITKHKGMPSLTQQRIYAPLDLRIASHAFIIA